ncbi:hypothetical protein I4200191B4_08340 [Pseudoflavonifractor gallinarum]
MYCCMLEAQSLAEFRCPQTAEQSLIVFSGGVYVGKHSSQAASVRAGNPNEAQQSGFVWERRGKGVK